MFKKFLEDTLRKRAYVLGVLLCFFMADKALSQTPAPDCLGGRAKFQVDSDSMLPFAPKGSVLFLKCFSHAGFNDQPGRRVETLSEIRPEINLGDVVAFKTELFKGSDGFKRVVGLPENTVRFCKVK